MKVYKPALTLLWILLCTAIAFAQRTIYFIDYAEVPPQGNYRPGYIVTLKNDTVYGRLRNTESLGSMLAPRVIHVGALNVILKDGGSLPKIAFIPGASPKSEQVKYKPEDIKAFGYQSSYYEQQMIELGLDPNQRRVVNNNTFKIKFALRDPNQDIHLLQRNIYDRLANFESKYVAAYGQYRFLQRSTEGRLNLYYDTEHDHYYVSKPHLSADLMDPNYDKNALAAIFGDSERIMTILKDSPEMQQPNNFVRLVGIYNLEAEGALDQLLLKDFIITTKGDTLKGDLQMKGLSNLALGMLNKVKLTGTNGQQTDLQGDEIKRIVKYINNSPIVFDAITVPSDGKRLFYQLQANGKMQLYYDARSLDHYDQIMAGDADPTIGSYLLVDKGHAMVISKKNFDEQAETLFGASAAVKTFTERNPEKKQYYYLPQLVAVYNSGN